MSQFIDIMNCGGPINWILFFLTIILFERFFYIYSFLDNLTTLLRNRDKEFFQEIYSFKLNDNENNRKILTNCFREFFLKTIYPVKFKVDILFTLVAAAPLLGLLGTVSGMIRTFKIITDFGFGNPAILSEGISIALLTTEAGLLVAFPGLLMASKIKQKSKKLMTDVVQQGNLVINRRLNND